jgi:hypothetical protein
MVLDFLRKKWQPERAESGGGAMRGLVIDLSLRRRRCSLDIPPAWRDFGARLRLPLPLLPPVWAYVPAYERYVSGVREIAVRQSLNPAKRGF